MSKTQEYFDNARSDSPEGRGDDTPPSSGSKNWWDTLNELISNAPAIIDSIGGATSKPSDPMFPYQPAPPQSTFSVQNIIIIIVLIFAGIALLRMLK